MSDSDVPAIAAGLSAAQRKWLLHFSSDPQPFYPIQCSKRTVAAMIEHGMIQAIRPPKGTVGFIRFQLTPLGIAVREHLINRP